MIRSLIASFELMRPRNCVLTGLSVVVGAMTAEGPWQSHAVLWAALGAALIAGAGNGMNDVLDISIDRRNRPRRPLPSGRMSQGAALVSSSMAGATGLTLAFVATPGAGLLAAAVVVGLGLYNWWGKRTGLPGNVLVGLLAAATFPYGAIAAGGGGRWWIPALFAGAYHLAREIVKGVEDVEGDSRAAVRTVALTHGIARASRCAATLFAVIALLSPLPGLLGPYGMAYLAAALPLTVFLADITRRLWPGHPTRLSARLLLGMVLGLLAVVLGELTDRI